MGDGGARRREVRDAVILVLVSAAVLLPFTNKAYHIDDTLFLWAAQHIRHHPADFFGLTVNWYGTDMRMADVTQNPPLACYYAALAGSLFGWGEPALHLAFLLPALAALWGIYRLAQLFGGSPLMAALITLLTPGFLVSSTTVMCDVLMLAFWVWAVVVWERGRRSGRTLPLLAAGVLILLAALTKYFGVSLIPLLAAYSLAARLSWRRWVPALAVPVVGLVGYQLLTLHLYGHGQLTNAARYVTTEGPASSGAQGANILCLLAFTGGCAGALLFFAPLLWRPRQLLLLGGGFVLALAAALTWFHDGGAAGYWAHPDPWRYSLQLGLWAALGGGVVALAGGDLLRRRDPTSLLLALWITGTMAFALFVNWAINGRSVLPLIPALAVLITRHPALARAPAWARGLPLVPSAALALAVTWGDYELAGANRRAASELASAPGAGAVTWFQGHWGFQYYMQQLGGRPWDVPHPEKARPGDRIIVPVNAPSRYRLPTALVSAPRGHDVGPLPR